MTVQQNRKSLGIIGFGSFGRLAAKHLSRWFDISAYDPNPSFGSDLQHVVASSLATAASCDIVVFAVPVTALAASIMAAKPHFRKNALVLDVGSVKVKPMLTMRQLLPDDVQFIGTHPLFGPQSAKDGVIGLKIVLCLGGCRCKRQMARFLEKQLGLRVIFSTPEQHDRHLAVSQGLTHLIAAVLLKMDPLPVDMTTVSFDLLRRAVDIVRCDAPKVLFAIEHENPFSAEARRMFFSYAKEVEAKFT